MTVSDMPDRHLSLDGFRQYLDSGAPSLIRLDGSPAVYLLVDPSAHRVGLRSLLTRYEVPDLSAFQNISAAAIHWNDEQWCELRVDGDMGVDAYPVLCGIADRVQLGGMDFGAAVVEALGSLREILAGRSRLTEEQQIGLFGELILLRHLLRNMLPADAVASWRGPEGEEHDFALADCDVEVKSTTFETRAHWINDVHQLDPKLGRRLYLLSIQFTGAGMGGTSLPEIISQVRGLVPRGSPSELLGRKLEAVNWRDSTAGQYLRRIRFRTAPALFEVDDQFPAMTPARMEAAGLDQRRFKQIRYLIDLVGLAPSTPANVHLLSIGTEG